MQNLNAADLAKYTAQEVASLVDVDAYSVRDEGFRRQTEAEKKLDRLRKQIAKAEQEMIDSQIIIKAALAELAK